MEHHCILFSNMTSFIISDLNLLLYSADQASETTLTASFRPRYPIACYFHTRTPLYDSAPTIKNRPYAHHYHPSLYT